MLVTGTKTREHMQPVEQRIILKLLLFTNKLKLLTVFSHHIIYLVCEHLTLRQGHLDRPVRASVFLNLTLVQMEIEPFQLPHRGCGINYQAVSVSETQVVLRRLSLI